MTSQKRAAAGFRRRPISVLIKNIVKCEPGVAAECTIVFPPNDPVFAGHFAGDPLVPGVILTEALAETARIAATSADRPGQQPSLLLSVIRQMKFFAPVRPAEEVRLTAQRLGGTTEEGLQFQVAAVIDSKQVAAGQLVLGTPPGQ